MLTFLGLLTISRICPVANGIVVIEINVVNASVI